MSKTQQTLLITTGILLVVFSFWIKLSPNRQSESEVIGKLIVEQGQVWSIVLSSQQRSLVEKRSSLYLNEQVETGPDSEAMLELNSKFSVRVYENSLVFVQLEGTQKVLHVVRGQINFENYGVEGDLMVAVDGRRVDPLQHQNLAQPNLVDIEQTNAASSEVMPYVSEKEKSPTSKETHSATQGGPLSEEAIHITLKAYSPAFFKCYANVLQKSQDSQAVTMSFTIEPSGKIVQPEVIRTTIEDEDFKKCLKEAFRRAEFKPFEGKAFQAVYPIKFQ